MLTYTGLRNLYGQLTNKSSSAHLTDGDRLINDVYLRLTNNFNWPFLQKQTTITTVASQQAYDLPNDLSKIVAVTVTVSTTQYTLKEIPNWNDWEDLNSTTTFTSQFPSHYFVFNNQIHVFPTPSAAGDTITVTYRQKVKELSIADNTTGTIVSITNGAKALVGSGTSWTAGMVGNYIKITDGFAANLGDNFWYKISAVGSTTTITLDKSYQGTTIAAGSAGLTLGQIPLIPEEYQAMLVYYAAYQYWNAQNNGATRAAEFRDQYNEFLNQMVKDQGEKSMDVVIEPVSDDPMLNPNLFITAS